MRNLGVLPPPSPYAPSEETITMSTPSTHIVGYGHQAWGAFVHSVNSATKADSVILMMVHRSCPPVGQPLRSSREASPRDAHAPHLECLLRPRHEGAVAQLRLGRQRTGRAHQVSRQLLYIVSLASAEISLKGDLNWEHGIPGAVFGG